MTIGHFSVPTSEKKKRNKRSPHDLSSQCVCVRVCMSVQLSSRPRSSDKVHNGLTNWHGPGEKRPYVIRSFASMMHRREWIWTRVITDRGPTVDNYASRRQRSLTRGGHNTETNEIQNGRRLSPIPAALQAATTEFSARLIPAEIIERAAITIRWNIVWAVRIRPPLNGAPRAGNGKRVRVIRFNDTSNINSNGILARI